MHPHHKRRYIYLLIIFILLSLAGYFLLIFQKQEKVIINGREIIVDVADTPDARKLGLSGRSSLCETCGMLFVFENEDYHTFWMKDMNFDTDIIWIRNGKIVDIEENVSYKTPEKLLRPIEKADCVLEVPFGFVGSYSIGIGDEVIFD